MSIPSIAQSPPNSPPPTSSCSPSICLMDLVGCCRCAQRRCVCTVLPAVGLQRDLHMRHRRVQDGHRDQGHGGEVLAQGDLQQVRYPSPFEASLWIWFVGNLVWRIRLEYIWLCSNCLVWRVLGTWQGELFGGSRVSLSFDVNLCGAPRAWRFVVVFRSIGCLVVQYS